ncbi:hypothetical protein HPB48_018548 [Haemaphysalis longicornis]|uniref:Uncharacterized protein n=1 Tax=Haemaphysalis longicornis TaxID=44386 RepID=A0A9J6FY45_HAELO|nr:hypothetical protein HPB48_018548 [Haemaphysalis longicornis]
MKVADVIGCTFERCSVPAAQAEYLDRTTASESARLRHMLTHEELGHRRPSQLLNTMRQLVGASNVDSNGALLKELFLQRLPQSTRIVFSCCSGLDPRPRRELADKVHDATFPSVTPLASTAE